MIRHTPDIDMYFLGKFLGKFVVADDLRSQMKNKQTTTITTASQNITVSGTDQLLQVLPTATLAAH